MDLSLKYTTNSNSIKSQNSQGQIGLMLGYNGKPFDLHTINDDTVTVKLGNDQGYIKDLDIDTSQLNDDQLYSGQFNILLDDPDIQNLPPDMYFIEVWINVDDQNNNSQQLIFPSSGVLPFSLKPNMVNGSTALPMITYENVRKDWEDFKSFVVQNQTHLEKDFATMDSTTNSFVDKVNSGEGGYTSFVNSADSNLTYMASSGESRVNSAVDYANNNLSNMDYKVNSAKGKIDHAADSVYSTVDSDVASAKTSIAGVVTSADADTTGTASHATSTIDSEAASVVNNVTSTMNSADTHIDHAADGIRGDVNGIVTSGNNYINNVKNNMINTTNSAVSNINNAAGNIDSKTDSAVKNINLTVNSADNYATNLTNDTNNKLTSADAHVDSTVSSADNHMSNFASDINDRTGSADSHIDSHVSSADVHVDSLFNTTNGKTASAASYIDSRVNGIDGQARSAYTRIHSSAHSVTDSADSNISSITVSGVDTLNGVVSGAASHLRKGVTSDVTSNVNHSMDDLRSDMVSNNKDVASNDSDVSALNSHVDMTRKDIATVYNQLFTSNAMNQQTVSSVSSSLSSQINDDETKSDANNAHTSLVGQITSLSAANKNLGDVLGSNTGSKLASLAKQFNDFDNTTQSGLSNSIASNATVINNVATSVNNNFNQTNATIQNNYNDLRGYDDGLQRQINDNTNSLQNQINDNYNKDLAPKGLLTGGDMNGFTTTGMYNMVGTFDNAPVPNNHHFWAYLTVLNYQTTNPNDGNSASPSQFLVINVDDTDPGNFNGTAFYRSGAGYSINGSWTKVATSNDVNNLQNQINNHPNWDDENWTRNNIAPSLANSAKNEAMGHADQAATSAINQANTNMSVNRDNLNNRDNDLQNQINARPTWDDENWTRSNANQAATNALNQANANMNNLPHWVDENWTRNNVAPSLANSARDAAIGTANGNMETNRVNLQNQITGNYNNDLAYKGDLTMWNLDQMTTTGIYVLHGQGVWNTPYGGTVPRYGVLIVMPNGDPNVGQKLQILQDNNGPSGTTISWRVMGGAVDNDWHVNASMSDITNLQNQINSHPNWNDENWTRNNVVPGAKQDAINQANQAATNALNQANAHTDSAIGNINGAKDLPNNINDFNKIITPGTYKLTGQVLSNDPTGLNSSYTGALIVTDLGNNNVSQKYICTSTLLTNYVKSGYQSADPDEILGDVGGIATRITSADTKDQVSSWTISTDEKELSIYHNSTNINGNSVDLNHIIRGKTEFLVFDDSVNDDPATQTSIYNSPTSGSYMLFLDTYMDETFLGAPIAGYQKAVVQPITTTTENNNGTNSYKITGFNGTPTVYIRGMYFNYDNKSATSLDSAANFSGWQQQGW